MPFGEHKGYGMAVACELLGGALTGSGTWHRPADTARSVINGMFTVLVDPDRLGTRASFEAEALAFVDWLRKSPAAPGFEGVRIAGEPERAARAERARGIAIDDQTWAEIVAAAPRSAPAWRLRRSAQAHVALEVGSFTIPAASRLQRGRAAQSRRDHVCTHAWPRSCCAATRWPGGAVSARPAPAVRCGWSCVRGGRRRPRGCALVRPVAVRVGRRLGSRGEGGGQQGRAQGCLICSWYSL
jgi:hypothetical protein